jgi:uncharacterized RDD family membrane protein YckC
MQTIKIQTSQNIDVEYQLAGIGDRLVAYFVDLALVIGYYISLALINNITHVLGNPYLLFFLNLPPLFYSLLCELFMNGQTVGKKAKGIQVISLDGGQASTGQYLIRWIFSIVDILISGGVVAVVLISLTEKSQRLADKVAGTTVVRSRIRSSIRETIFEETAEQYQPQYPGVVNLTEKDIALVREILIRNQKLANFELLSKTAEKIKAVLEIESRQEPLPFLLTVLQDYNHITSRLT